MPVQVGGDQAAALPDVPCLARVRRLPVSRKQRPEQHQVCGDGTTLPGTRQSGQTEPPEETEKKRFGPGMPHFAQSPKLGA